MLKIIVFFGDEIYWVTLFIDNLILLKICWFDLIGNGEGNRADRILLCTLELCDRAHVGAIERTYWGSAVSVAEQLWPKGYGDRPLCDTCFILALVIFFVLLDLI